jgi:hypothetical protein
MNDWLRDLPSQPLRLLPTFPFLLGAACWARPEKNEGADRLGS